MAKIYLDGGHGGKDGGAIGNGLEEANLTLDITKRTRDILEQEYENAVVKLSRTTDVYRTLEARTNEANSWGADVLVSVHINAAANESADGFESYVYTKVGSRTKAFQNVLHKAILKRIGLDDRGQKAANFHMVRDSKMTAVLTENGFISNKSDAGKMKSSSWIEACARGHAEGIAEFLGLKKKAAATKPAAKDPEKLWRVQVGAYGEKENAEKIADDLRKIGYRVYIYED